MKQILAIILSLLFLSSCSMFIDVPSVCDKPEATNSYICKVASDYGMSVEDMDLFLRITAVKALNDEEKQIILGVMLDVKEFIKDPADYTYQELVDYFELEVSENAYELIIISSYVDRFKVNMVIDPFDRYLLLQHIENQEKTLSK